MAGHNRLPSRPAAQNPLKLHGVPLPRQPPRAPNPDPSRAHTSVLLEDRIAIQHREIQSLLVDNQGLAATHVALKQELAVVQQELRHLSATAANVKAERDPQVREVYERSLKMDAEVRAINAMSVELAQVRTDVQKLAATRQEFTTELEAINGDLAKAKSDSQRVAAIKAEIETVRHENQRGRAAIEYEKRTRASNLEQRQAMEKNMVYVAREIENLRAELANAEKRARAAAAAAASPNPRYAASYGNPDMRYGGSPYTEPYGMHQVQGHADSVPQYAPGATQHALYDMHRSNVHS